MTNEPQEELGNRRFLVTSENQSRLVVEMGDVAAGRSSSDEDGSSVEDDGRDLLENESTAFD